VFSGCLDWEILVVALTVADTNNYRRIAQYKNSTKQRRLQGGEQEICQKRVYPQYDNQSKIVHERRKKVKWLTAEEIKQIAIDYQKGATVYELADQYGCHRDTISENLKKHGVNVTVKKFTSQDGIQELVKLYESGLSTVQLAKRFNFSASTIKKYLRSSGVQMRTRWDYAPISQPG
jgi:IS30 family transposase